MESFLETLLSKYGYLAIGIGTFLEGEIILILAAMLATQGQMRLEWVIVAAAIGAFLGDIVSYFIGSWKVDFLLERMPSVKKLYPRAQHFFKRFGIVSILVARFFYGLRVPTGVICGMTKLNFSRFFSIALIGCTLWAVSWSILTHFVGQSLSHLFVEFQHYQKYTLMFIAVLLPLVFLIRKLAIRANKA
jgi:membrane protein DedA with SNARE-associated domain